MLCWQNSYSLAHQSKFWWRSCCRARTGGRQARHPGDKVNGTPSPVSTLHLHQLEGGASWVLCPGPGLSVPSLHKLLSVRELPVLCPVSLRGTVLPSHSSLLIISLYFFFLLIFVLSRQISPLRGFSSLTYSGSFTSHLITSHPVILSFSSSLDVWEPPPYTYTTGDGFIGQ